MAKRVSKGKLTEVQQPAKKVAETVETVQPVDAERYVVPILHEELQIGKRVKRIGGVQVHKTVHERVEVLNVPIRIETCEVERIPINMYVDEAPPIAYEGDDLIVPVLEEVLIVEKRLMLKEKIRIKRHKQMATHAEHVTLREEHVEVTRDGGLNGHLANAVNPDRPASSGEV